MRVKMILWKWERLGTVRAYLVAPLSRNHKDWTDVIARSAGIQLDYSYTASLSDTAKDKHIIAERTDDAWKRPEARAEIQYISDLSNRTLSKPNSKLRGDTPNRTEAELC